MYVTVYGVDAFLPISGLMGIFDWAYQGELNGVHPAATVLVIFALVLAIALRKSFCSWVCPIGFISDHLEVAFDLDTEAKEVCDEIGLSMVRAATVGIHPKFIGMIRELIQERVAGIEQRAIGEFPPNHDVCPIDCCLPGATRRPATTRNA